MKSKLPFLTFCAMVMFAMACTLTQGSTAAFVVSPIQPLPTPQKMAAVDLPISTSSCTVTTGISQGSLNLRSGPGVQFSIIAILQEGQVVTVSASSDEWIKANAKNIEGWINSNFVTCKKENSR